MKQLCSPASITAAPPATSVVIATGPVAVTPGAGAPSVVVSITRGAPRVNASGVVVLLLSGETAVFFSPPEEPPSVCVDVEDSTALKIIFLTLYNWYI